MIANEILGGRRVISSKDYSYGSTAILDMRNNMWAVITVDGISSNLIDSKMFCYTDTTEKEVWKSCLQFYKKVKNCLAKKDLSEIFFLDN